MLNSAFEITMTERHHWQWQCSSYDFSFRLRITIGCVCDYGLELLWNLTLANARDILGKYSYWFKVSVYRFD